MKVLLILLGIILLLLLVAAVVLRHPAFGPHPLRPAATLFENEHPTPQFTGKRNRLAVMWHFFTDNRAERVPAEPLAVEQTDLRALSTEHDWFVWFGHSSYLFCLGGKRVLVDPLLKMEFPASVMMRPFPGTDIYTPEQMPTIDLLIITHEHWDHMDYATLRDLRDRVQHVVCPLGIAEYLVYWGYDPAIITEMDWHQGAILPGGLFVTCLPTRHFSNRLFGANRTLWASFMVESAGRHVYVGGDGGYDDRFQRIRQRFPSIDLAIMENGQYNTDWAYIHMLPADLEKAMLDLGARQYITVHHDKFSLAPHAWNEPDSVARSIAQRQSLTLLDHPIGHVTPF